MPPWPIYRHILYINVLCPPNYMVLNILNIQKQIKMNKKQETNNLDIVKNLYNEDALTAECFKWAWDAYPETRRLLFHVPNEGQRSPVKAGQLKAMGLIPGMMDFVLVWGRTWGIELKIPGGRLSPSQQQVHAAWNKSGYSTFVVYSPGGFKQLFSRIIQGIAPEEPIIHYFH